MSTAAETGRVGKVGSDARVRKGVHGAGLWGLAARGVLYLVLAWLAIQLVIGHSSGQVDTRGALHHLAHNPVGSVLLWILTIGFAGFSLWHLYVALRGGADRHDAGRRLGDGARAVVYGLLCALSVSFLTTSKQAGSSDRTDQTWTAKALTWSGGRLLVGAAGIVVIGLGIYLVWRGLSRDHQDEAAVLEAAPRAPSAVTLLGSVGNLARGGVVILIGAFVLGAAITHDPNESVGLDGALKRLLDATYGEILVVLVAIGFAAFGIYSLARAWANREQPQHRQ